MKHIHRNPWVPVRTMSGNKLDIPGLLVLVLLGWSFYNLFNLGYDMMTRKFVSPAHE